MNCAIHRQLTKSLLKADFNLEIDLSDDRLCPPVPVRWNYVRWVQELVDTTSEDPFRESSDFERDVVGLDVGVGASCIYGLLAARTRERWRMLGTEIDGESIEWARGNVVRNGLEGRVKIVKVDPDGEEEGLVDLEGLGVERLDFVMMNPPFYASREDFLASANLDHDDETVPSAVTIGAPNEMICPGGDVAFVTRLLRSSLTLQGKVQWYTAMLSKLSSLRQILALLKQHDITNFACTSLHPGRKTKRWAVAWSFKDRRPRNDVARHGELVLSVLPQATAWTVRVHGTGVRAVGRRVREVMEDMDGVRWEWRALLDAGVMECGGNVWSRAARRKRRFENGEDGKTKGSEERAVALGVKIMAREEEVEVRWLRGNDHTLFESFCGMLKRAMSGSAGG